MYLCNRRSINSFWFFSLNICSFLYFLFQIGSEFEDEIFEGLQTAMKNKKIKNTIVLSGLKLKGYTMQELGEFDFIAFALPSKSIIHIEAKRGNNKNNRDHAERQLNRGQAFFEENFPFPSSENWNYIKMMCFGEFVEKYICDHCKPFILSSNFIKDNTIQSVSKNIAEQFYSFLNSIFPGDCTGNTFMHICKRIK
jgi:hypothetical protein